VAREEVKKMKSDKNENLKEEADNWDHRFYPPKHEK
jgi:hypothetical protein